MSHYNKRRLDQSPSQAEIQEQQELLTNTGPKFKGYGMNKPFAPPKVPDKPEDTPTEVKTWLNEDNTEDVN